MKHIVLIIDSLVGGGAETTNIRLAKLFLDNNFEVTLIVLKDIIEIEYDKRINFICLYYKKNNIPSILRDYFYSQKLHKVLSSIKTPNLIIGSLGLSHKLMNKINDKHTFYYALHGTTTKAKLSSKKGRSYTKKRQELIQLYDNKNLICVSQGVQDDILSLPINAKSIDVIYNPFDFNEIIEKSNETISFDFPDEYIVHVGRFAKVKKHDILIEAFSLIENKNIKLVLVGEGTEKTEIEKLTQKLNLQNRVIFAGFQKNPYPIIKNAKLLILSSENEGFGNVLIEALILDTNVISTNTLGGREIIELFKLNKSLVNINNSQDLAHKIDSNLYRNSSLMINHLNRFRSENILVQYKQLLNNSNN